MTGTTPAVACSRMWSVTLVATRAFLLFRGQHANAMLLLVSESVKAP
jgi:hypothetical protein